MTGRMSYYGGDAAEEAVARHLEAAGCRPLARRFRGRAGEIDLIVQDGDSVVFVEVKKARSIAQAALRLGRRQMDRICLAAQEFVDELPGGMLTEMRFDVALVDVHGRVEIRQNAFGEA